MGWDQGGGLGLGVGGGLLVCQGLSLGWGSGWGLGGGGVLLNTGRGVVHREVGLMEGQGVCLIFISGGRLALCSIFRSQHCGGTRVGVYIGEKLCRFIILFIY